MLGNEVAVKIVCQLAVITVKAKQIIHWSSFPGFSLKAGRISTPLLMARISPESANSLWPSPLLCSSTWSDPVSVSVTRRSSTGFSATPVWLMKKASLRRTKQPFGEQGRRLPSMFSAAFSRMPLKKPIASLRVVVAQDGMVFAL